ncbi:FAD-binding oxidoreductase, partial [Calidithermus roseus]|uniref:FAD-binding oxidoreductase n=1 Tax=Calidithermus roseus TaxID=1644118 RepID=UPI0011C44F84
MAKAKLTGRVVYPGDFGWDDARKGFNQRFDVQPRAVVFCQSTRDVANAILWARENNLPFRARSGRHSYEGYSLINEGLIIDLSDLDNVSVNREHMIAQIGAGIHMLELSEWLGQVNVTLPLATGPTVGLAGLALGGGFGLTSRKYGLTCDNLIGLEIVDAEGKALIASEFRHPDLFWACKGGGGGNFGIATRFFFRVHPVSYAVAFMVQWDWSQFEAVVAAWQDWAWGVDNDVSTALQLTVTRSIKLYGLYTPDNPADLPKAQQLLAPLLQSVP